MTKTATSPAHTAGPWTIVRGGGHAPTTIRGSEDIHTNGRERNEQGISSASYSDEVCAIRSDLDLPGPAANARLIAAAPELLKVLKSVVGYIPQTKLRLELKSGKTLVEMIADVIAKAEGRSL